MQIIQKYHHKVVFKMIENHENRDQNHDLKSHMIILFVIRIMHNHILSHYETLYTDILTIMHHAEMTVKMNDQIRKVIMLFNKKHVSFVIFLNNLLKQ